MSEIPQNMSYNVVAKADGEVAKSFAQFFQDKLWAFIWDILGVSEEV